MSELRQDQDRPGCGLRLQEVICSKGGSRLLARIPKNDDDNHHIHEITKDAEQENQCSQPDVWNFPGAGCTLEIFWIIVMNCFDASCRVHENWITAGGAFNNITPNLPASILHPPSSRRRQNANADCLCKCRGQHLPQCHDPRQAASAKAGSSSSSGSGAGCLAWNGWTDSL